MSVLTELRKYTSGLHESLHSHPALNALPQEHVTYEYYVDALKAFALFYTPLESRYFMTDTDLQKKFPAGILMTRLNYDLQRAGIKTMSLDRDARPFLLEEAVAYLYLREGSNLGGKVISKNLAKTLSLEPVVDNQFFWGHGHNAGKNWQLFLNTLNEIEPNLDNGKVVEYAVVLFGALNDKLNQKDPLNA